MIDFQVRLIHFPTAKIRECVIENEDGSFTIFVEKNLTKEEMTKVCYHALSHIMYEDFGCEFATVDEIEKIAHERKIV